LGTDLTGSRLKGLLVPLHLPSKFQQAVTSKTYQVGPLGGNLIHTTFLAALGGELAGYSMIVPILVEKKVAAILYADTAGGEPRSVDLSPLYRLCDAAGGVLEQLIRRRQGGR
jgi:hypothetical protein